MYTIHALIMYYYYSPNRFVTERIRHILSCRILVSIFEKKFADFQIVIVYIGDFIHLDRTL